MRNIDKEMKTTKKVEQKTEIKLPVTLGFISTNVFKDQTFININEKRKISITTDVNSQIKKFTVNEATNAIWTDLYVVDMENGTNITSRASKDYIKTLIESELSKISEPEVSEENLQRAKSSFGGLLRPFVGITKIEDVYGDVKIINTSEMNKSLVSESTFKHHGGLVTTQENLRRIDEEERAIIENIQKNVEANRQTSLVDQTYIYAKIMDNLEQDQYRSSLDVTLLSHRPERDFVEKFVYNYSKHVDAWVKSKDKGFYSIPYIHRPGTHSTQKDFNPDFFIKRGKKIIVVEIKSDDDSTVKNKDKLEGAVTYFEKLNEKLNDCEYEFHFLQPTDYANFFEKVIVNGEKYVGELEATLSSKSREDLKGEI